MGVNGVDTSSNVYWIDKMDDNKNSADSKSSPLDKDAFKAVGNSITIPRSFKPYGRY